MQYLEAPLSAVGAQEKNDPFLVVQAFEREVNRIDWGGTTKRK
jgi:hypothetical protein